jgi:hypothetical protein
MNKLTLVGVLCLIMIVDPMRSSAEDKSAPPVPVLVELYTSEGCSSCPPADAMLKDFAETQPVKGATVIPLGLHVDYWNRLGWVDRFSSPSFTQRQREFCKDRSVYTPQMVVDGQTEFVGSERERALSAIAKAAAAPKVPIQLEVRRDGERTVQVRVHLSQIPEALRKSEADVLVAVTEQGLSSDVKGGENAGTRLQHAPIVRVLQSLGKISAGASEPSSYQLNLTLDKNWEVSKLRIIAFAQKAKAGAVIAVGSTPIPMN